MKETQSTFAFGFKLCGIEGDRIMGEVGCRLLEKKYPEFRPVYELIYGYNLANDKWNETFLDTVIFNAVYRSHL